MTWRTAALAFPSDNARHDRSRTPGPVPGAALRPRAAFLPGRLQWIADYECEAQGNATCRFLRAFGDERRVDPGAETVRPLHDHIARACEPLPLGRAAAAQNPSSVRSSEPKVR